MSSSAYEGIVDFAAAAVAANRPVGVGHTYQLANNAAHLADSASQVRVAWAGTELTTVGGGTSRWDAIATFGPFPATLDSSGVPYPMRVRLAGRGTQAAITITFRLVVATRLLFGTGLYPTIASYAMEATTTSITSAWLDGTASTTLLTFVAANASAANERLTTIDAVGGDAVQVGVAAMKCVVYGKTANASSTPTLTGVYLAEYVGV